MHQLWSELVELAALPGVCGTARQDTASTAARLKADMGLKVDTMEHGAGMLCGLFRTLGRDGLLRTTQVAGLAGAPAGKGVLMRRADEPGVGGTGYPGTDWRCQLRRTRIASP